MPSPYEPRSHNQDLSVTEIINSRLSSFMDGFEDRLSSAMQKALDIVTSDLESRLQDLESDQARILRHLGLDRREPDFNPDREVL